MPQRKLVRRPAARRDLANAVSYLRAGGGSSSALRFVDEVEAAFTRLCSFPHLGTLWPTAKPELEGLRRRTLPHFPYSIFYLPTATSIEVVRVLHNRQDFPPLLENL